MMDTIVIRGIVLNLAHWTHMKRTEGGELEVHFTGCHTVTLDSSMIEQLTGRLDASERAEHRRLSAQIVDALDCGGRIAHAQEKNA